MKADGAATAEIAAFQAVFDEINSRLTEGGYVPPCHQEPRRAAGQARLVMGSDLHLDLVRRSWANPPAQEHDFVRLNLRSTARIDDPDTFDVHMADVQLINNASTSDLRDYAHRRGAEVLFSLVHVFSQILSYEFPQRGLQAGLVGIKIGEPQGADS